MSFFDENIHVGTIAALTEINHRNQSYDHAERRLAEKLKPARLTPFNYSHKNGRAASNAVIEQIREAVSFLNS